MMQKDIDALEGEKSNSIKKYNILKSLKNINAVFTSFYYRGLPKETINEGNIAQRIKSRRQRLDITNKKKENIDNKSFSHYFDYSNPDTMLKRLRDASDEKNKFMVESINKKLTKMRNIVKNVPKDKAFKIEENEKIFEIVERFLSLIVKNN